MHAELRERVCDYLERNADDFKPFVEDDEYWEQYLARMRREGTWAGNVEVQATARVLGRRICVHRVGQPRWVLSPYYDDRNDDTSRREERRDSTNVKGSKSKDIAKIEDESDCDEDCAFHLVYDAESGCEHYASARIVGTTKSDFAGGPISLKLINDAQTEIFEVAQKTGYARNVFRIRRHLKMALEENASGDLGNTDGATAHKEVIDRACETLLEEVERERKVREARKTAAAGTERTGEIENGNGSYEEGFHYEYDDGNAWERAKTGRRQRSRNKSSLADECEALAL